MSALSDYQKSEFVNASLRGGTYTGGPLYFALFTSDPTDAGTGSELADSGYVRKQAHETVVSDGFTPDVDGVTSNAHDITFAAIVDAKVTLTHWGIFDAPSGGNLKYHGALTNSKEFDPSDVASIPAGSISLTFA